MSGVTDARIALETRLAAIAAPLATEWENTVYIPVEGTPYQKVTILFADPANWEMGRSYQELGYMQIDLRYPIANGPGAAATVAQALREWFYRGLTVSNNGLTVTISKTPSIGTPSIDETRYVIAVKIPFFANNS